MNSKPRLIDINLLKKVTQTHDIKPTVITTILNYIKKNFLNFIINYSDLIIVLLILGSMLYFRYKYNIGIKEGRLRIRQVKSTPAPVPALGVLCGARGLLPTAAATSETETAFSSAFMGSFLWTNIMKPNEAAIL